jgi:hypothetical protein
MRRTAKTYWDVAIRKNRLAFYFKSVESEEEQKHTAAGLLGNGLEPLA